MLKPFRLIAPLALLFLAACLFAAVVLAAPAEKKKAASPKTGYSFVATHLDRGVALKCIEGCAWKDLTGECGKGKSEISIDRKGVTVSASMKKADLIIRPSGNGTLWAYRCAKLPCRLGITAPGTDAEGQITFEKPGTETLVQSGSKVSFKPGP